jgi:23S rRNA pseudouridine1911/1915/1917 synthase
MHDPDPTMIDDLTPTVFTVPEGVDPARVDKILAAHYPEYSRSRWQAALEAGQISCEGLVIGKGRSVKPGDTLEFMIPRPPPTTVNAVDIPLEILFEDKHIVVVNKRAGMVVHPGAGTGEDTLVHALLHHTKGKLAAAGGVLRPGIVHRLDKETSGIILCAKTDEAYMELIKSFSEREPDKRYIAICAGAPQLLSGVCREPIDRHPNNRVKMAVRDGGKDARTDWAVDERFGTKAVLMRCKIHTGRTHQIRVHLTHLNHPILGDHTYGRFPEEVFGTWPAPRVMLHAASLKIPHPVTGEELAFEAPMPPDFLHLLGWLRGAFGSSPVRKVHFHA